MIDFHKDNEDTNSNTTLTDAEMLTAESEALTELPEFEDLFFYHIRSSESTGFGIFSTLAMVEIGDSTTASEVYEEFFAHIRSGNASALRQLLNDYKLNINVQDNSGMTGLGIAATHGYREIISILLEHHADVNVKDTEGRTPLEELATSYCDELWLIFWKYLDDQAKQRFILITISCYNLPALTYALNHVSEEIKQAVFQSRINGIKPLVYVTQNNRSAFAKVLLDHGHELVEKKSQDMTDDEKETRKFYKNTLLYKMHAKRWRDILFPLLENITKYEPTPTLIDITANAVARNVNCDKSEIEKLGLPPELNESCLQAYKLFDERKKHLKPPHVKAFLQKANSLSHEEAKNISMAVGRARAEKRRKH